MYNIPYAMGTIHITTSSLDSRQFYASTRPSPLAPRRYPKTTYILALTNEILLIIVYIYMLAEEEDVEYMERK